MARPITGTPPLSQEEWDRFIYRVDRDKEKKVGLVPTPKLKEAVRKIRLIYGGDNEDN